MLFSAVVRVEILEEPKKLAGSGRKQRIMRDDGRVFGEREEPDKIGGSKRVSKPGQPIWHPDELERLEAKFFVDKQRKNEWFDSPQRVELRRVGHQLLGPSKTLSHVGEKLIFDVVIRSIGKRPRD